MANKISSAAIYVPDRNRARDWYVSALGWKAFDDDGEHWVTVGDPKKGARLHLCEKGSRLSKADVGESGILIVCDDFAKTVRSLKKAKAKWATPPTKQPWGQIARFTDPFGNVLWLSDAA
jgi:predicted enzyme related to lactoylglutathione lyase